MTHKKDHIVYVLEDLIVYSLEYRIVYAQEIVYFTCMIWLMKLENTVYFTPAKTALKIFSLFCFLGDHSSHKHMILATMNMLVNQTETFRNSFRNPCLLFTSQIMLYCPLVKVFAGVLMIWDSKLKSYNMTHILSVINLNTWLSKAFRLTTWCREDPTPFAKNKSGNHNKLVSLKNTILAWHRASRKTLSPEGDITLSEKFTVNMDCDMNFEMFPFDFLAFPLLQEWFTYG